MYLFNQYLESDFGGCLLTGTKSVALNVRAFTTFSVYTIDSDIPWAVRPQNDKNVLPTAKVSDKIKTPLQESPSYAVTALKCRDAEPFRTLPGDR